MTDRSDPTERSEPPSQSDASGADHRQGSSLFSAIPLPTVEYATPADRPVVERTNPAFRETFASAQSPAGDPLESLVDRLTSGQQAGTVVEWATVGLADEAELTCDTAAGTAPFRVRTVPVEDGGYLLFCGDRGADRSESPDPLESVTHSVRNPLEVAKIQLDIARETGDVDHLEEVARAHERIERILDDADRLGRERRDEPAYNRTDLGAVARDAWQTVRTEGASLRVAASDPLRADESRLRELFENLFRNAVYHGRHEDDAPEVTIEVGTVADGFYVADDGRGIPEEDRDRVLDPGYTTREDGTGLGLSIVHEIARAHGWTVSVGESEGGGARFEFTGIDRAT